MQKAATEYTKERRVRKRWQRVVAGLSCVVMFFTTYALVLPAIALEMDYLCGKEEHSHTDACYSVTTRREQICGENVHSHTEGCFDKEGNQLCLYADFVVHQHSNLCYDGGKLVCTLAEREAHTHDASCYTSQLTCGQEESEGHAHTGDCYQLICEATEEGHSHSEDCYKKICGQEESEGHSHTDACYESSLTCGKEEIFLHTHSESCYAHPEGQEPYLTCGQIEVQRHAHTDSCFETVSTSELTCTVAEHTHSTDCYSSEAQETTAPTVSETEQEPSCGKEEHTHTDECYGPEDGDGENPLSCGKEEHTHGDTCYPLAATEEIVAEEASLFMDSGITLFSATDSPEQLTLYPGQVYTAAVTAASEVTDDPVVGVTSTKNTLAKLKLGTSSAFTGDTVDISKALYTFAVNEGGTTTTYTVGNSGAYLCLQNGKAGFPQTTNGASIEVESAGDDTVYLKSSSSNFVRYLYFWRDGKNYFDQQEGTADATKFLLYRPAGEDEKSSDGIPGYVNVTSVTDSAQYLIAAQYNNDYYVLYPSTSTTDKYSHVAKVAPYEMTITAKKAGTATVTAGGMTYDVTVTDTITIERGETAQIELPKDAVVEIADGNIASSSIDNDGVVTINGTTVGTTTATVTIGEEKYTWKIQVNAPTSFQLAYADGPAITFNIVDQNGKPLSAPRAVDVPADSGKRYVFGTTEDTGENVKDSFAPAIDGYIYNEAIWNDNQTIFSVATNGYDSNNNDWRFYITEPPTNGQYYSRNDSDSVTLHYVPEGAISYDLNLPLMGTSGEGFKGSGWFEGHEPSISDTVQDLKAGDKLARPDGYYEETGVAGIPGLYRWKVTYVNELGIEENWKDADGNLPNGTMIDDWYGEGRFDGWTYTAADGVTYLLDPEAEFQQKDDGTIFVSASRKIGQDDVIEPIPETEVPLPEGARLVGHWTEISNVVSFFINYKGTILDTEGDVTGRRADTFTKSVAVGHVFYGKQKVGVDGTFGSDANAKITSAFRDKFDKNDPSTQIVVEYLRDCTKPFDGNEGDTPQEGDNYKTSMSIYSPGANSIMVKNNTLSLLKQTQRTVQVATGKDTNPTIDPENCDGDHYEVRWYVLKEQADAWHIDGVLVAKTQEIDLTKTFSGLSSAQSEKLMDGTVDGSGNRTDNFQIDTELGGEKYLTITVDPVTGQYSYEGSDSTQQLPNSYHWTLNAIMDEKYTMTEENYELDGYDVSSIIVHYFKRPNTGVTEVTFEYSDSTEAFEYDYPVTGGHTTAVSFNNFYTPTGTGAMAIVKRDSTSSATDSSGLLEGAEFTLYSKEPSKGADGNWKGDVAPDSNQQELIVSTNHNGTAYFSGMSEGEYYLAETLAPSGYTASGGCWKVKVEKNSDTGVVVTLYEKDAYGAWMESGQTLYNGGIKGSYVVENTAKDNTVTVTKTFSGLTAAEMNTLYSASKTEDGSSTGYQIIIGQADSSGSIGSEEESSATLTLDKAQRSQDGFTFTWTIHDLPITGENGQSINYGLKEINYLVKDNGGRKKYADVAVTGTLAYGNKQELSLNIDVDNTDGGTAETVGGTAETVKSFTFHSESSDHIYLNNHYTDTYDVRVNKVDTKGKALSGAEFALYGPYQDSPNSQKFITFTGEDGTAQSYYYIQTLTKGLEGTHTGTGLKFDTNYVLKEVTAPEGYTLAEPILIRDTAEENHDGVYLLEVKNTSMEEATVSVTARKAWANGDPAEEAKVTLNLYRRAGDSGNAVLVNSQIVGANQNSGKNTISDTDEHIPGAEVTASEWTVVWENLKAYDTVDADNAVEYQWFVTETSVGGYVTTYSDPMEITCDTNTFEAGQALGQTKKTVTITNTAGYVLPNTGGNGSAGWLMLGGMLMLVSCLYVRYIPKRSKRGGTR